MRKNIVAGNWKMNTTPSEGLELAKKIVEAHNENNAKLILIPPFTHLAAIADQLNGSSISLGAQNCHQENSGAFTGEVSASMLKDLNVEYVVLGHSERRQYFSETNETLARKADAVLDAGMQVIYCCGETLENRESGKHFDVVWKQVSEGIFHLNEEQIKNVIIAYEPVWAIGTGKTASDEQAQEMHAHIRQMLTDRYSSGIADEISILYGGSVKPDNAKGLFGQQDIDGGLIGGASLKADSFLAIGDSFASANPA